MTMSTDLEEVASRPATEVGERRYCACSKAQSERDQSVSATWKRRTSNFVTPEAAEPLAEPDDRPDDPDTSDDRPDGGNVVGETTAPISQ